MYALNLIYKLPNLPIFACETFETPQNCQSDVSLFSANHMNALPQAEAALPAWQLGR